MTAAAAAATTTRTRAAAAAATTKASSPPVSCPNRPAGHRTRRPSTDGSMPIVIYIAAFGALGCLARYWLSGWVYALLGRGFPYGTFVVNVVGAFLIGLIMEFGLRSTLISQELRVGLTIGF